MASIPLARAAPKPGAQAAQAQGLADEAEVLAICKDAAERCACVLTGFAWVLPHKLLAGTRGAPKEAFARQLLMAGLVRGLGFTVQQVAKTMERHEDTVTHALAVVDALKGGGDDAQTVLDVLGEPGVREFLGGKDLVVTVDGQGRREIVSGGEAVEECLAHAERLIDDTFAAFELVAVRGSAYCREIARRSQGAQT